MTSQALDTLLCSSTSSTTLDWIDYHPEEYEDSIVDQVLQGLKQNRSLKDLAIHFFLDSFLPIHYLNKEKSCIILASLQ